MIKKDKPWNLRIPQELYDRMVAYDEIKWSVVMRKMLEKRLSELDKQRKYDDD